MEVVCQSGAMEQNEDFHSYTSFRISSDSNDKDSIWPSGCGGMLLPTLIVLVSVPADTPISVGIMPGCVGPEFCYVCSFYGNATHCYYLKIF